MPMHSLSWPHVAHYELVCRVVVNSLVCLLVSEFTVVLSGLSFGGVDWCLVCLGVLRVVYVCVSQVLPPQERALWSGRGLRICVACIVRRLSSPDQP